MLLKQKVKFLVNSLTLNFFNLLIRKGVHPLTYNS